MSKNKISIVITPVSNGFIVNLPSAKLPNETELFNTAMDTMVDAMGKIGRDEMLNQIDKLEREREKEENVRILTPNTDSYIFKTLKEALSFIDVTYGS